MGRGDPHDGDAGSDDEPFAAPKRHGEPCAVQQGAAQPPMTAEASTTDPLEEAWADAEGSSSGLRCVTGQSQVDFASPAERGPGTGPSGVVRARLVGVSGDDAARSFPLMQLELSIGRAPGSSVLLTDVSVSRDHARLLRKGGGYVLKDLESGNGTFVNGQPIKTTALNSGDEIGFGKTRFLYLMAGDDENRPAPTNQEIDVVVASAADREAVHTSPPWRAVATAVAILIIAALVAALGVLRRQGGNESSKEAAFGYFIKGRDAFKARAWKKAEEQFVIILGLDPNNEYGQRYFAEIARERENERRFDKARQAHSNGELATANTEAMSIKSSVYSPQARELRKVIDTELAARVARARTSIAAGRPQEALRLLETVEAIRPGRPDVGALRAKALRPQGGGQQRQPAAPNSSQPTPATGPPTVLERAIQAFARAQTDRAVALLSTASSAEAKALAAKMEHFLQTYESALVEHRAKRTGTAIKLLKQAGAAARDIVPRANVLTAQIDHKTADMFYVRGIQAFLAEKLPAAYEHFRAAAQHDSTHDPSLRKLDELARRAEQAYRKGLALRKSDPKAAQAHWQFVLQIVPATNEYYRMVALRLLNLGISADDH